MGHDPKSITSQLNALFPKRAIRLPANRRMIFGVFIGTIMWLGGSYFVNLAITIPWEVVIGYAMCLQVLGLTTFCLVKIIRHKKLRKEGVYKLVLVPIVGICISPPENRVSYQWPLNNQRWLANNQMIPVDYRSVIFSGKDFLKIAWPIYDDNAGFFMDCGPLIIPTNHPETTYALGLTNDDYSLVPYLLDKKLMRCDLSTTERAPLLHLINTIQRTINAAEPQKKLVYIHKKVFGKSDEYFINEDGSTTYFK